MLKKLILLLLLLISIGYADEKTDAFNMVNEYRQKAGMINFKSNSYLDKAAYNHSHYSAINRVYGHYEDSSFPAFTGVTPTDRAYYARYLSSVAENYSLGTLPSYDYKGSVSGLFSAIYHRFGFLSFGLDEMGSGVDKNDQYAFYTYDMGNSMMNSLCSGKSYDGYGEYYLGVCKDPNFKISKDSYDNANNFIKKQNSSIVIWPPKDSNFTDPAFFDEIPDPLPNQSVSGYPVSISFNDYYIQDEVLKSFTLKDYETNSSIETKYMDKYNDPNDEFTKNEFAIFPLQRLKWGDVYQASVVYEVDGDEHTLTWCYETKDYPYKRYTITSNTTLNVMSNTKYMLYIKPQNDTDVISGFGTQSYIPTSQYEIDFIDQNTLYFKTTSSDGDIDISLNNNINITLQISNSDSATPYTDKSDILKICSNNQDIYSIINKEDLSISKGWNLISLPVDTNISYSELNSTFKTAISVWTYKNGWRAYGAGDFQNLLNEAAIPKINSIKKGVGFWVNSDKNATLTFSGDDYNVSVSNLTSGWHLLGTGGNIDTKNLADTNANIETIWIYKNGWRAYGAGDFQNLLDDANIPKITSIKKGVGFWVYVE